MFAQIIEDVKLKVFNMIKVINALKTLVKHTFHINEDVNLVVENIIRNKSINVV